MGLGFSSGFKLLNTWYQVSDYIPVNCPQDLEATAIHRSVSSAELQCTYLPF